MRYGNAIIALSNLIFICEKIQCRKVLVEDNIWNIKKPFVYKKYNIIIEPVCSIDCKNNDHIICLNKNLSFHFGSIIKKIYPNISLNFNRMEVIRGAILRDTPNFDTDYEDLYIHIRSKDIFRNCINPRYTQPPLCFYKKILNKYKFKNVYIISNGKENPCINKLTELYPNIKYIQGSIIHDSILLFNAYKYKNNKNINYHDIL